MTVSTLAHLYYDIGRFQEAEVLFERSLAGFEKLLGSSDPSTLGAMNNLANILKKRGQYRAARRLYRTAKAGLARGVFNALLTLARIEECSWEGSRVHSDQQ